MSMPGKEVYQWTLFADDRVPTVPYPLRMPKEKAKPAALTTWEFSDHACRHCFGRVMQRVWRGKVFEVKCAECGTQVFGDVMDLCCCGADCGALGRALECFKNPTKTADVPQEIMVRERPESKE